MIFRSLLLILVAALPSPGQPLETVIQRGHELAVLAVAISPDSNFVATASKDRSAKLWEAASTREIRTFLGHDGSVTAIAFSPDGNVLITGSNDKHVKLWDIESGRELYDVATPDYITAVAVDPRQRFFVYAGYNTSGRGDSATVVDYNSKQILARIAVSPDKGLGSGVDVAISPDGKQVAFGEDNRVAAVYETRTWKQVHRFTFQEGYCGGCGTRVQFSSDGKRLYVASQQGPLKKYNLDTGTLEKVYENVLQDLTGLGLSADDRRIAIATEREVKVYDTKDGHLLATLPAQAQANFHQLVFGSGNEKIIVAADDNTALVWDYAHPKAGASFTGFLNQRDKGGLDYDPNFYWQSHIAKYVRYKNSLQITRDGKSVVKGKFGTRVKRWDIATGKTEMEYTGHQKAVLCLAISPDGKKLLTGGGEGKIMLWDLYTGDSLQVIHAYREPVFDLRFSADGSQVVSSSWDGSMKIHDLQTGKMLTYFSLDNASAYHVLYHPNDLYVYSARLDNRLQMWETDTRTVVRDFVGHTDIITSLALSRDQKTLMSTGWDGSIRLWDVGTGLMTKKFRHPRGGVHTALFSADETQLYSAGADRTIRVWNVNTGKVVRTFEGHKAEVTALVLSPDNKMLISHSLDGVTKFWDLHSGNEFFEHIHLGDHDWLVKNPDGYFTATDNARKYIHFVSGTRAYAVDQFFHEFYRPDLLPKFFQQRGGAHPSGGIQGKLKRSPPPTVKIAVLPVPGNKAEVLVRMTDNGAGVSHLRITHNGKSIMLDQRQLSYPSGKGNYTTYKQEVELIGGNNIFSAVAVNRESVESDPRSVDIFTESGAKHGSCYILALGINQYENAKLNLNYAKPDAESFSKVIHRQNASLFKDVKVITLYDKAATRVNILDKLDELSRQISPEDVFVFYYAGHGSMVDDKFYFIPTENARLYDQRALQKEAIEAAVLQEKLKKIKALKQLIIMDACQSGGSVELLATRGANEEKAIAQLSRSTGIHVLASAGSEQFAAEFEELGHGLFTFVLLKALEGEADGAPRDGKVTIYELKSYIDDQVPEITRKLKGKPQYPHTFSRGQDFPVVIKP